MKLSRSLTALVPATTLLLVAGLAPCHETKPEHSHAATPKKDIIMPAEGMQWEDGPLKGTHVAKLKGDWMKGGPYEVLVKFDAGFIDALHHHSHDLKIVVISGTFLHTPKGGAETRLGPGSYLVQAAGQDHVSGCSTDGPCLFFMRSSDKFDLIPAAGAAAIPPAAK